MKNSKKITLKDLMTQKEKIHADKKAKATKDLYIKSLDGIITIEAPDAALARDAAGMEIGDAYIVYSCVVEPCLKSKELQEAFGCVEPMDIVDKVFAPGEISLISIECAKLAGYIDGVKAIDEIKNL